MGASPGRAAGAAVALCLLVLPAGVTAGEPGAEVREAIRRELESAGAPPRFITDAGPIACSALLPDLYERRGFEPLWLEDGRPGPSARQMLESVLAAEEEGLRPEDYHADLLQTLLREAEAGAGARPASLARLDLVLTDAFLLLGTHLLAGRVNPETFDPEWVRPPGEKDLSALVRSAEESRRIAQAIHELVPSAQGYEDLRSGLAALKELALQGGWPEIPAGAALRLGDEDERVVLLARRLGATGDLQGSRQDDSAVFDEALDQAVRSFQERHGLTPDGVAGSRTLEAMNVPVEGRIRQIELNMERWRWLPLELGRRHVLVNIPSYSLSAVEDGRTALSMRVIVGRTYRRTPVLSDHIRYLVLNPWWEVPPSLAVQDIVPLVRKDASYLARHGFHILSGWGADSREVPPDSIDWRRAGPGRFPYRLRQAPGPTNSLGRVKFMFPNKFNVYLHDTPARGLFAGEERALSSGCIRVERPVDLAEWLLRGAAGWDGAALEQSMKEGVERTVRLPEAVPVHLEYWTAWATPDGRLHFRKDLYGRDEGLDAALKAARAGAATGAPAEGS